MAKGYFIITDISGYTVFMTQSELEHAVEILQSLFKAQLARINPPFIISGFRGDAIFMYVPDTNFVQGQVLLEALESVYLAFASTLEQMQYRTTCPCRACREMSSLNLKMAVHYGSYVVQQLGDRQELQGADVIVPHRMLKNRVIEQTGIAAYALFSRAAADALGLPELGLELREHVEDFGSLGEMEMLVYDLSVIWQREKERRRKAVPVDQAWVKGEAEIAAPPALVWDYFTKPELKMSMVGLGFMKRTDEKGGRVGVESEFHCSHEGLEFSYQIVDWQPFDYFTIRQTDSWSRLEYHETYRFAAMATGTRFTSATEEPPGEQPPGMQAMFQNAVNHIFEQVKAFIEADIAAGKVGV